MKIMSLFACGIVVGTAPEASCEPRRPQMCEACMCHMILLQSCFGRHFIIVGSRLRSASQVSYEYHRNWEASNFYPVVQTWNTNARLLSFVCSGVQVCSISQAFIFWVQGLGPSTFNQGADPQANTRLYVMTHKPVITHN